MKCALWRAAFDYPPLLDRTLDMRGGAERCAHAEHKRRRVPSKGHSREKAWPFASKDFLPTRCLSGGARAASSSRQLSRGARMVSFAQVTILLSQALSREPEATEHE